MKRNVLILTIFLSIVLGAAELQAVNEKAIPDGSGKPDALSILGCDSATCTETRRVGVATGTHELLVTATVAPGATGTVTLAPGATATIYIAPGQEVGITPVWDFEAINYSVPAGSGSGVNLNPSATASLFYYKNDSTQTVRVMINGPAAAAVGLQKDSLGSMSGSGLQITSFTVFNTGLLAASQSIIFGR